MVGCYPISSNLGCLVPQIGQNLCSLLTNVFVWVWKVLRFEDIWESSFSLLRRLLREREGERWHKQ